MLVCVSCLRASGKGGGGEGRGKSHDPIGQIYPFN